MKPLLLGGALLLAGLGTAGALYIASLEGEGKAEPQTHETAMPAAALTPGPDVSLWRWLDVTVLIPDGSGIRAFPDNIYFDPKGLQSRRALALRKDDPTDSDIHSYVLIDAIDGTIYRRRILDEHSAEIELVLSTVSVSKFDPVTAPWPYNGDPPEASLTESPSIRPDPATGMYVSFVTGDGGYRGVTPTPVDCDRAWEGIQVNNGRSSAFIGRDARTGSLCKMLTNVQPEDLAAFERFLDRVAFCIYEQAEC
jgi:hypothetical protein